MKKTRWLGRTIVVAIGFVMASTVSAERIPVGIEGDSGGDNHYILECGGNCNTTVAPGTIDPAYTGAWYDPSQSGHGLFIEVLPDSEIQAAWFTFNPEGTEQAWFVGVGSYAGNSATIPMTQPTGGRWIPNFDPHQVVNNAWGTLTLTFTDSDHGRVDFSSGPGYGAGSMSLTRLTSPTIGESSWVPTASLAVAREGHTATLLADGKVLVAGGLLFDPGIYAVKFAELYDPAAGTWTRTADEACYPELGPGRTATLLSNGKVLVAGQGCAELYDPATGTWTQTGSMALWRTGHTASRLADGRVLVAGGAGVSWDEEDTASVEVYDPVTDAWSLTGSLAVARYGHTSTLLQDGRVLVAGGHYTIVDDAGDGESVVLSSTEIFDPRSGAWTNAGELTVARDGHTATLLPSGKVLIAGGLDYLRQPLKSSEIFDPATGTSSAAGDLNFPRSFSVATPLQNGDVLLSGGSGLGLGYSQIMHDAERYDTTSGKWLPAGQQIERRIAHTATLLQDGQSVLVAGGKVSASLASAELYTVATGTGFTGSWYDPAQSGHGLILEDLPGSEFLAAWFTFNPAGTAQAWFVGVGTYDGNTANISNVLQPSGGRWIPNFDASHIVNNPWGTLKFTFTDCNHGRVEFASSSGYGTGSMNLTRLTQPAGLACS